MSSVVTVTETSPVTVEDVIVATLQVGAIGPQGPPGPAGSSYRHDQGLPAEVWTIDHDLGYRPGGLYVEDSAGTELVPTVEHPTINQTVLTFIAATDGYAVLS